MITPLFSDFLAERKRGAVRGLYSVCSSHSSVLDAAMVRAARSRKPFLVEATANQVNQYGGYTGMTPRDFAAKLSALAEWRGVPDGLVSFGGDHLGPYPWRKKPAAEAMAEAEQLVRAFVAAGAQKIHFDASMALGDDPSPVLDPEVVAERAARLCAAAEFAYRDSRNGFPHPVYVIGTEVPVPGGFAGAEDGQGPAPTKPEDLRDTIMIHRAAFARLGLESSWQYVIAVVAQPGLEFDAMRIYPYRREKARSLIDAIGEFPGLVLEGHSTDYQTSAALRSLVEDGVAILKVGPALTFALREALFGLAYLDDELAGRSGKPDLLVTLERVMEEDPTHWKEYYGERDRIAKLFGFSDRVRYYWERPELVAATGRLMESLSGREIPRQLLSQYVPHLDYSVLDTAGEKLDIRSIPEAVVDTELVRYERACFPTHNESEE